MSSVSILDDTDPIVAIALWGYDLRGSWVLEFAAFISEDVHVTNGPEWDRPEWRQGELWHGNRRVPIPWSWALPWASDAPPSRRMWAREVAA